MKFVSIIALEEIDYKQTAHLYNIPLYIFWKYVIITYINFS